MGIKSVTVNPNRTQTKISDPNPVWIVKKYQNGSCKVVQNISEPEILLTESDGTRKTKKKFEKTDLNVQISIQYNYMKHKYILKILI